MRPFFTYYGGKWRAAPRYPAPTHDTIIEPFAGSAGYALRHPERSVRLFDTNEKVIGTWRYLIGVSAKEILDLPDVRPGQAVSDLGVHQEAGWLVGWWLNKAKTEPAKTPSRWARDTILPAGSANLWGEGVRRRIAAQVEGIRHWTAEVSSYESVENEPATWFIDPPYVGTTAGRHYTHGSAGIDYAHLGEWCRGRRGQVMVCEATGADWLPFTPFADIKATSGRGRTGVSSEALWVAEMAEVL